MKSKRNIVKNRIITAIIVLVSGYILIVNNSLDFLLKFGIIVNKNIVVFIGFLLVFIWGILKAENGEL